MKRQATVCFLPILLWLSSYGLAENQSPAETFQILRQADRSAGPNSSSPVRRIFRTPSSFSAFEYSNLNDRSFDGRYNNLQWVNMNAANTPLRRLMPAHYEDLVSAMTGTDRPSPRLVSNVVNSQYTSIRNRKFASDFLWQWGQFLDHDIDLSEGTIPPENTPILVPAGDPFFDPDATGQQYIAFNRSIYDAASGTNTVNPRQQLNEISGWIDASNVYGSEYERVHALRVLDGSGKLKTSAGNLLPFNTMGLPNAGGNSDQLFVAGDVRANEQLGLTAMHTLFVREHNRLADYYSRRNPGLKGEEIYRLARQEVMAQMQVITYQEFIPVLLGENALSPYQGYQPTVDASVMNSFSTAAYRLGHSLLSRRILRLDAKGREIEQGHLPLREAFFAPSKLAQGGGIDPLLRGLARQVCQDLDVFVIDDVRNFLFGAPGQGGFDLASLNIQRGRDHGLPSYNEARRLLGFNPVSNFDEISSDPLIQARLAAVYDSVDQIDLWVGGLAEDHVHDALVGSVFFTLLKRQFEHLRDGDRFWYQISLDRDTLQRVESTRLSDIIRRNTNIRGEVQSNVFVVPARFR